MRLILSSVLFCQLALGAFPSAWARKCSLTINHTKAPSTQAGIPALVGYNAVGAEANLPQEMLVASGANAANSDGSDIRFSSDINGVTGLHFEIVRWTQHATTDASRHAEIWVNVPSVSSSADTVIYVWYKNSSATAPAANDATFGSQGVWDVNYRGVYHLGGTSLALTDSTANGYTLTNVATAVAGTGAIGGGVSLNGSTQYLSFTSTTYLDSNTGHPYTLEAWAKASSTSAGTHDVIAIGTTGVYSLQLRRNAADWELYHFSGSDKGTFKPGAVSTSAFQHVVGTWPGWIGGAATPVTLYLNASPSTPVTVTTREHNGVQQAMGADIADAVLQPWNGILDELRISDIARSADWITTEYNNQSSPSTFWTVGTPVDTGLAASSRSRRIATQ